MASAIKIMNQSDTSMTWVDVIYEQSIKMIKVIQIKKFKFNRKTNKRGVSRGNIKD